MAGRMENIIRCQRPLFELPEDWEKVCLQYAALIIKAKKRAENFSDTNSSDCRNADI